MSKWFLMSASVALIMMMANVFCYVYFGANLANMLSGIFCAAMFFTQLGIAWAVRGE